MKVLGEPGAVIFVRMTHKEGIHVEPSFFVSVETFT